MKQEAQLMLTDPRDAFRGQSRLPNMVPFHVRYFSSCAIVTLSLRQKTRISFQYSTSKILWPLNPGQRSLKVIQSGTIL